MPSQYAALEALRGCKTAWPRCARPTGPGGGAVGRLAEAGLPSSKPDGAFYVLADVSAAAPDSVAFARDLAARPAGVACAPGESFGPSAAGMLRLSLAASPEAIDEGIRRIGQAVAEVRERFGR